MFNTVKKLAKSFKKAVAPTPRPALKLTLVAPVVNPVSTVTIDETRQEVVATLKAVLDKKTRDEETLAAELVDRLWEGFQNCALDNPDKIRASLRALGIHDYEEFGDEELDALGAAIEYYREKLAPIEVTLADAVREAANTIVMGNYTYFINAYDCDTLGVEIFDQRIAESRYSVPEWIKNYFDYESLGEDYVNETGGIFTDYGFFAEGSDWE